jgi:Bacterial SH3 domain
MKHFEISKASAFFFATSLVSVLVSVASAGLFEHGRVVQARNSFVSTATPAPQTPTAGPAATRVKARKTLSLATADRKPPTDLLLTHLTFFAQQGGGGGTSPCETPGRYIVFAGGDALVIPSKDLDGSGCGFRPGETVTLTLRIPGQPPITQTKLADETGKAAIYYRTSLRDPVGVYGVRLDAASGSTEATLKVTVASANTSAPSILLKDDALLLFGFRANEKVRLAIYRYDGTEADFVAIQALDLDDLGSITLDLEGELKSPADGSETANEFNFVALGEQSGQVSTGYTAVSMVLPDAVKSLSVHSAATEKTEFVLREAPCDGCRAIRTLAPNTLMLPVLHPSVGRKYLQNDPHSDEMWWYVQLEDGTEGWVHDVYTMLNRLLRPPAFRVAVARPPQTLLVWFNPITVTASTLPTDLNAKLLHDPQNTSTQQTCKQLGTTDPQLIVNTYVAVAELGAYINIEGCNVQSRGNASILVRLPDGRVISDTVQVSNGVVYYGFRTSAEDKPGSFEFEISADGRTARNQISVYQPRGARVLQARSAADVLSLFGFQPSERVRVLAYSGYKDIQLEAWQSYTVDKTGALNVVIPFGYSKLIVLGDQSGEVEGLLPRFGAKKVTVPSLIANTETDRLLVRQRPGRDYTVVAKVKSGTTLEVLGAPSLSGGETWWPVRVKDQVYGWATEQYIKRSDRKLTPGSSITGEATSPITPSNATPTPVASTGPGAPPLGSAPGFTEGKGKAIITSPKAGSTLSGDVDIIGTAQGDFFSSYRIEFEDRRCGGGVCVLAKFDQSVANGLLMRWNTRNVGNGIYLLRLVVVDQNGLIYRQMVRIKVAVNN